jgi:tetratricopeptide (TPR) repeat protein
MGRAARRCGPFLSDVSHYLILTEEDMRTLVILLSAVLLCSNSALPQKLIPKNENERRGAESYNKAVEAFSAGDFAASIPLFLAADSLIGEKSMLDRNKLRFALGAAYLKTGKPAQALEWFVRVASSDSTYPYVHLQAAESSRLAGNTDQALKFYQKAAAQAPDREKIPMLKRIGEIQEKKGQIQAAIVTLTRALGIAQGGSLFLQRGQLYDRLAQAIDHAQDENFDIEGTIKRGEITVEKMERAIDLREQALADYRSAAADASLATTADRFIERSEIILQNNRVVISEINYQKSNE